MDAANLEAFYREMMSRFDQMLPSPNATKPIAHRSGRPGNATLEKRCAHCGNIAENTVLIEHTIVPEDIAQKIGLLNNKTVALCFACHRTLHDWYAHNVSWVMYNEPNRLKAKPLLEVAMEYESAYNDFVITKLGQSLDEERLPARISSV
jgi:hypothetical protein